MFLEIHISAPDGRRPGRAGKGQPNAFGIAANGCPPMTFWRASASQNVAEAEREKRGAKPEEPQGFKRRAWVGLLGAGLFRA